MSIPTLIKRLLLEENQSVLTVEERELLEGEIAEETEVRIALGGVTYMITQIGLPSLLPSIQA